MVDVLSLGRKKKTFNLYLAYLIMYFHTLINLSPKQQSEITEFYCSVDSDVVNRKAPSGEFL